MKAYSFWRGRRVFLTGHTGFMGGWLSCFLTRLGAEVTGYALAPQTTPSFCVAAGLEQRIHRSVIADVRDAGRIGDEMAAASPEVVFHLAAQPIVRTANADPVLTYDVNVMGTVKVLEAVRKSSSVKSVVVVTTDKVYRNNNWYWPYRENDQQGGMEPYSSSKACTELVLDAYRNVYFQSRGSAARAIGLASIRTGNVIGGGDWAADRLVPDAVRGFAAGKPLILRNPKSTRPWQHVLDPFPGYLEVAERLAADPAKYSSGWNFGPAVEDCKEVGAVAEFLCQGWGGGARHEIHPDNGIFEERLLTLDSTKAQMELGWRPRWRVNTAISRTIEWYKKFYDGADIWPLVLQQCAEIAGE